MYSAKHPLCYAYILLAIVFSFSACSKHAITPTSHNYGGDGTGTGTDTTGGGGGGTSTPTASFYNPTGIAVDAAGNIYVADYGNNLIREISAAGIVTTLAGTGQQGSNNGASTSATFNGPTGITVDASGNVYVADGTNNQIRKIAGGLVTTVAGSDSTGAQDGTGSLAYFFGPGGLATDASGNIIVADAGNNLIRMVTPLGVVSTVAGTTDAGDLDGAALSATFNNPSSVALDAAGNIYVADLLNDRIRKISGGQVTTLAGHDTTASINGVGAAAAFYFPSGVAVDASGNAYVTEYVTNLIRKVAPDGTVTTFAGSGNDGQADSTGTAASFSGPTGIATDAAGNLYVADTYNNVIRKITPAGVVSTVAGDGSAGAVNGKAVASHKVKAINAIHNATKAKTDFLFKMLIKKNPQQYYFRSQSIR